MCLLVFYVNPAPKPGEFALILINVRDEIYDRPAKTLSSWENPCNVIGGMDLEPGKEGGTWLAMNTEGKIAALLNILQPNNDILPDKKGRGTLPVDFLTTSDDCMTYLNDVRAHENDYNGFLLFTLDFRSLEDPKIAFFSKFTGNPPQYLKPGIHTFGNCIDPEQPWPRAVKAKEQFFEIIEADGSVSRKDALVENLFGMLRSTKMNGLCDLMKKQGCNKLPQVLDKMTCFFIRAPEVNYGSRCHSVILIDSDGKVDYYEKSRRQDIPPEADEPWIDSHLSFCLKKDENGSSNHANDNSVK